MEKMAQTLDQTVKMMAEREGKYLTFSLMGEGETERNHIPFDPLERRRCFNEKTGCNDPWG
jgi:hypothetical protein